MMVDSDLGAVLSTMFMVQYEPHGAAGPARPPVRGDLPDPRRHGGGDVRRRGLPARARRRRVGGRRAVSTASATATASVRWLETQAPQLPPRHGYRFARDWDYLRQQLGEGGLVMRTVVIGGTSGIGLEVARGRAARGDEVVLTGRDRERAAEVAKSVERRRRRASRSTSTTPTGWRTRWPGSGASTGWWSPRSSATRTRSRLRRRPGDEAGRAQAGRLHRGRAHAAAADERRLVGRAVRRAGQGPALPRLDHRLDRQRRRGRPGQRAGAGDGADPGERAASRASSATARSGRASRRACSTATSRGRRPGGSRPWPTSSTPSTSCSRTAASTPPTCTSTAGGW